MIEAVAQIGIVNVNKGFGVAKIGVGKRANPCGVHAKGNIGDRVCGGIRL